MKTGVTLFYGDTEYAVTGNYRKRVPARMYMPNGDPGYPEEPAEFEIEDVTVGDQSIMELLQCCWTKDGKHILDDMEVECLEKVDD